MVTLSRWLDQLLDTVASALLPRLERAFIELEEKEAECEALRTQIAGLQRRLNEANYLVDVAQEERDEAKRTCADLKSKVLSAKYDEKVAQLVAQTKAADIKRKLG